MHKKTITLLTTTAALALGAAALAPTGAVAGYPMCVEQPGSDACTKESQFTAVKNGRTGGAGTDGRGCATGRQGDSGETAEQDRNASGAETQEPRVLMQTTDRIRA